MSKITAQFIGFRPDPKIRLAVAALIAKKAHAVKVVNRRDLALLFAQNLPANSLIVFRDEAWQKTVEPGFTERLLVDPDREANRWIDHHQPIVAENPRLVCETMNEWAGWDWSDVNQQWVLYPPRIKAYAHYEAKIAEAMFSHGYRVALGHYAVAHPPYEAAEFMVESLAAAEKYRSFWCFHCYNGPHLSTWHGPDGRPQDLTFRAGEWWSRTGARTKYPHVELLVTEFDIDKVGGSNTPGWKTSMTAQMMQAEMYGYADPVFDSDPILRAVFWYRFGHDEENADEDPEFKYDALDYADPPRADFDLARYIIDNVSAAGALPVPVPPPAPAPEPTPSPEPIRSYVVVGRLGVNIRLRPSTSGNNPVGSLPFGFPILARPLDESWVIMDGSDGLKFYVARQWNGTTLLKEAG